MAAPQTATVIVNWNGEAYLEELLRSLDAEKPGEIIVVDNHSTDGSLEILKKHSNVSLIANTENLGFASAANQGIAITNCPHVLILNVDLRAIPGSVHALEEFLKKTEDAGAVAPKLLFPDGALQPSCRKFPTVSSLFFYLSFLDRIIPTGYRLSPEEHAETRTADQPMGAALMVRKKVLNEIRNFDESYFLYMEDVDLCERIIKAGWKIYYYPVAEFIHDAGGSSRQDPMNSQKHFVESALIYFRRKKHGMIFIKTAFALAFLIRSLIYFIAVKFKQAFSSLKISAYVMKFE
jgi:GT2 family glycosyltransferase